MQARCLCYSMRILYFHQHFSTPAGATGTRSYEMARALVARGQDVTMVCGTYGGGKTGLSGKPVKRIRRGEVDGIQVVEICLPYSNHDGFLKRSITFLRFALKSIGIACRTKYEVLFATSTPLTAGIPGIAMRALKPRRPFVFEVRDLWPELPREMGVITNPVVLGSMSVLEWLSYKCARVCIGLSPGIVKGIRRRCSGGKTVEMIPNGCDLDLFQPRSAAGIPACDDGASSDNEEDEKTLRAVFTGAHGMANGLDAVLDAAAVLKRRGRNDIELVFIGDGKLKPELVARARAEELQNCTFLDPIPKIELARKLRTYDAGLMILANVPAFYYGTSPNKFFDYIASGMPVINNYPGWLADMIVDAKCGVAVPPGDPEALADALERVADCPEDREAMGANARKLAETEFDRKKLAQKFVDCLEQIGDGGSA